MKKQQKPVKKTNSSTRKPNTLISSGKNNRANDIEVAIARSDNVSLAREKELKQRMKRNAEWEAKMDAKTKSTTKTAPKTLKYKKTITKMK